MFGLKFRGEANLPDFALNPTLNACMCLTDVDSLVCWLAPLACINCLIGFSVQQACNGCWEGQMLLMILCVRSVQLQASGGNVTWAG